MKNFKKNKGFTLIELILYVSLSAVMLLAISITLSTFFEGRIKSQAITEVEGEGMQVLRLMTQTIRNASSVNYPGIGGDNASLSLNVVDPLKSPTIFDLSSGEIRMTEGLNEAVVLTNPSQVDVSSLSFENLGHLTTPGSIAISFIMSHANPGDKNEYDYSRNFYGSATLRY